MPLHIRDARPDDVPALARLHVETFNETHCDGRPHGPAYELRHRQWSDAFASADKTWFCLVVEDGDGQMIGFAKGTRHDGGVPGFEGELNKIYVLRRFHRQGVGRLLLCSVARRFTRDGVRSMLLFGDRASPSNGFYEAFGAKRLYNASGGFDGGYGWRDLSALVTRCDRQSAGSPVRR
ncbi:MAG: N-acetyltransferase family protein [Bacteroidales bacterium]